ncbi:MAG: triose-phosphate isomerase [Proteobacteria bacterium]|nr:triose-phosphate isomerase [Pseudomonadota bacterium]MDE3208823.1 triose-phosphate isomerase [Pseudomonadota bacterium]
MKRKIVVGNWKMQGSYATNEVLLHDLLSELQSCDLCCDVAVAPPSVYLDQVGRVLKDSGVLLSAQDVSAYPDGAHTGECSARMLVEMGCSMVIVGHSERRACGESDSLVALKAEAALDAGMTPVICVGETLEDRQQGRARQVVEKQVGSVIKLLSQRVKQCCFAYEPIWAIGSGQVPGVTEVSDMLQCLSGWVGGGRFLYGGSVNLHTAPSLFSIEHVDGVLVGGASLNAKAFAGIIRATNE